MTESPTKFSSSLGIKYPTLRDGPLKTGLTWLDGKRADDGAEGLWRVHDGLYDITDFIKAHPGGPEWLHLTKGTDITEAFETHHLSATAEKLLKKYFVRDAKTARNSPFTFHEGGFYRTLKKNVVEGMKGVPKGAADRSKRIIDCLMVGYVVLAVSAALFRSFALGMLSGICVSLTAIAAHNFFHQKDNFRMYYFNLTLMEYQEWRISHALSHHLYTNTINDLEISSLEPFLEYLPGKKVFLVQCFKIVASPVVYSLIFLGSFIKSVIETLQRKKAYSSLILLPFSVLAVMTALSGDVVFSAVMFFWIQFTGSLHFGAVGLNAAHHHPDTFHDGDSPRPKHELDWGIHQLDAVMDRKEITGSHFLVLTNFGDHALHHMFPTIDHGLLEHLYPIFLKICSEFGVEWRLSSQIEQVKGQIRQIAKIEPNPKPPKQLKKIKFT